MKKNLIIFGNNDLAELAYFYMLNDPNYRDEYEVVAFTVEEKYLLEGKQFSRGTWSWSCLEDVYNPSNTYIIAPISDNVLRERIYKEGQEKGFRFISYISSKCTNYAWAIGKNCFILEDNTIQPFVEIGNNVVLWSGNHIGHHSKIEDNCFIASHVVISGHCNIGKGSFIGVNSTLRDGITIGKNCVIGMGSLVTKSTEPNKTYIGSPAKEKLK